MNATPPRRSVLILAGLTLATSACGSQSAGGGSANPTGEGTGSGMPADFTARAGAVAAALRSNGALSAYQNGVVLLGDAVRWGGFKDDKAKEAAGAGRAALALPTVPTPGPRKVTFADGTSRSMRITSAESAAGLAITMPCGPAERCPLSLDGAKLVTADVLTNHGVAKAPFWEFTGGGMSEPLRVLALDAAELVTWTTPELPAWQPDGITGAMALKTVDGAALTYEIGLGACDTDPAPLVMEAQDVVIVGGSFTPPKPGTACTANLISEPVSTTLSAPLGSRPLVDVATGGVVTTPMWR